MLSSGNRDGWRSDVRDVYLPLVKNEKCGQNDTTEACGIVPLNVFAEIEDRERRENRKRDDFLNRLQLRGGKFIRADAVRRDLEAVFEERNPPAHENHFPKSGRPEFQMTVPGEGHENIGNGEQDNCSHRVDLLKRALMKL